MRIRDLHDDGDASTWAGLAVAVDSPRRPRFRVEYASRGLLRVVWDGAPVLWSRWHGGFDGFSWLRAQRGPSLLPPISAAMAREIDGSAVRWARAFASMLAETGVLHADGWEIAPACVRGEGSSAHLPRRVDWNGQSVRALSVRQPERALESLEAARWTWDLNGGGWLVGLRAPSPPEEARVKAWRKVARDGHLPPLVIYFVSLMDAWVLLDGHDRLQAAMLEGVTPPMISVSRVLEVRSDRDAGEQERISALLERQFGSVGPLPLDATRSLNSKLFARFTDETATLPRTSAWPINGGGGAWLSEVTDRLSQVISVGPDVRLISAA